MTKLILLMWHAYVACWRVTWRHPNPLHDRPDWWLFEMTAGPVRHNDLFYLRCCLELLRRYPA